MTDQKNGGGAPAVAQLIKLLGMLGSDFDGEVLVAARKACALLVAQDWTWEQLLANDAASTLTEAQIRKVFTAGIQQGETLGYARGFADAQVAMPGPKNPRITIGTQLPRLEQLLAGAERAEADGLLTPKEAEVTGDVRRTIRQFGQGAAFTQKQLDWLRAIEQSLRRRGYL